MPEVTIQEIHLVKSAAIRDFIRLPTRCRMNGMVRDLVDDEKRIVAYISATIEMLGRLGVDVSAVKGPSVTTIVQEVIEGHG